MHIRTKTVGLALSLLGLTLTGCATPVQTTVDDLIDLPQVEPAPIAALAEASGFSSSEVAGRLQIAIGTDGLSDDSAADLAARIVSSTTPDPVTIVRTFGPVTDASPGGYPCVQAFDTDAGPSDDGPQLAATLRIISTEQCWRRERVDGRDRLTVWTPDTSAEAAFALAWVLRSEGLPGDDILTLAGPDPASGDVTLEVSLASGQDAASPALAAFATMRDDGVVTSGRIEGACLVSVDRDADATEVEKTLRATDAYPYEECTDGG